MNEKRNIEITSASKGRESNVVGMKIGEMEKRKNHSQFMFMSLTKILNLDYVVFILQLVNCHVACFKILNG